MKNSLKNMAQNKQGIIKAQMGHNMIYCKWSLNQIIFIEVEVFNCTVTAHNVIIKQKFKVILYCDQAETI